MLMASLIMISIGIYQFNVANYRTIILQVFGFIGCIFSLSDLKTYCKKEARGKQRIAKHLSAMLGATIATVTAFSVTNIPLQPQIILWLGPTILLTPVIVWWNYKVLQDKKNIFINK